MKENERYLNLDGSLQYKASDLLHSKTIFEIGFQRCEDETRLNLLVVQNVVRFKNDHILRNSGEHGDHIEHRKFIHREERLL